MAINKAPLGKFKIDFINNGSPSRNWEGVKANRNAQISEGVLVIQRGELKDTCYICC
jgi:hypothetical protein